MDSLRLKDLWSNSAQYRAECQTADDIRSTLELLELGVASTLVDVGCGNGAFSIAAARAYPHLKVLAYDALGSAIGEVESAARDLGPARLEAGIARAEDLPIAGGGVHRGLCRAVLHLVARPGLL